jgi:outer membrane murein-binding lipoprotein Lpp
VKKTVISTAVALLLAPAAFGQNATLDQVAKELAELKAKNERLEAEVDYLKQETKGQRKDAAVEAVEVGNLKANTGKFTWSGDFRYRNEQIQTAPNAGTPEHTRGRDRIRLRLGVTAKINDTVTGRFQVATAGGAAGDPRSTNQTLGEDWSRKSVGIDLAYVDWKPIAPLSIQLGKTPQPWLRTASYFWDGDLTPEGAAIKYTGANFFANGFYEWLNERHSGSATGLRADSKLIGGQLGWKQPIGKTVLTVAAGYFDVTHVQDEQVSANAGVCTGANGVFFGNSTNGNSTYTAFTCSRLLSDFNVINALAQLDMALGGYPLTLFVDYMQNDKALPNPVTGAALDTALSAGVLFNKASNPKTWEVGVIYQQSEADAVFGQFHDSDFGDGRTDTDGVVIKGAYAPAANWTVSGTLFLNKLNNDTGSIAGASATKDLDYKRLQLDLNYKF